MWSVVFVIGRFLILFSHADFCRLMTFFSSKLSSSKKSFRNTIKVSNGMDPDQDRRSVGPDQVPKNVGKRSPKVAASNMSKENVIAKQQH